ncbi:universal stress protein [Mucilaginibacter sp. FT3.2]|uniref:universal stress protein n=1 Tax=Mucilaginibacter sp. FT3.2 TaxID=2723090 RepID=UPI001618CB80|nr:universal stress protein [Mucilaginibacter sp. FT3.2]MBB6232271.1 nucleotide-binding universal stress UspA family protein [Mucilaginibacter sp. FT3.2]
MKIKKILIGIDDSTYARNAAVYGFDIAHSYNAAVGLAHIIEPIAFQPEATDGFTGIQMNTTLGIDQTELIDIQAKQSAAVIEGIKKEYAGQLEVTSFTEFDITADGIINCAKQFGADLIVIGTHRRSGLDRFLLGSIAENIVRHSVIPVLVVPFIE